MSTITTVTDKKPTIIFGGAFNPPTIAHEQMLAVCCEIARDKQADIWVLPSGERIDKTIGVPYERRRAYINAMIADVDTVGIGIEVIDYELTKTGLINTYDTAQYFEVHYPDREFLWIFGADSIVTMKDWPGGDWLHQNLHKIVFLRDGFTFDAAEVPHSEVYTITTTTTSSTELRRRIASDEDYSDIVGKHVHEYLQR